MVAVTGAWPAPALDNMELTSLLASLLTTMLPVAETPKLLISGIHLEVDSSLLGELELLLLIAPATPTVTSWPLLVAVASKPSAPERERVPDGSRTLRVLRLRSLMINDRPIAIALLY